LPELLAIAVAGLILVAVGRAGGLRVLGPAPVLRRFKIDEAPAAGALLDVAGRAPGPSAGC